jgi:hypothetical protein
MKPPIHRPDDDGRVSPSLFLNRLFNPSGRAYPLTILDGRPKGHIQVVRLSPITGEPVETLRLGGMGRDRIGLGRIRL